MEVRVGSLLFSSQFDSGNLCDVTKSSDGWICARTVPDCAGTPFATENRTWFYFGVAGGQVGENLRMRISGLNKQGKLYSQGLQPIVARGGATVDDTRGPWHRACTNITFEIQRESMQLSFEYIFPVASAAGHFVFFAFCYPHSYGDCQELLSSLDAAHARSTWDSEMEDSTIYYHREVLVYSLDRLRVDLLTISDCVGRAEEREGVVAGPGLFPEASAVLRAHLFPAKPVFFLTARVHPGETPASHVFNGFLKFILNPHDPRARELRRHFVFKLIPMLNPDGVKRGHYRADSRGANLNRFYDNPDPETQPSVFATRAIICHHARKERLQFYVDLHAHAAKRGCFIYGNALSGQRQVDNIMFPRLIALNSAHFDFGGCNFSEQNMFSKDRRDGLSKEGSGRVGIYLATNITHSYTLECNYNMGATINRLPAVGGAGATIDKVNPAIIGPIYGIAHWEDVGKGVALAALDMIDKNPWSRLSSSEFRNLHGLRKHISASVDMSVKSRVHMAVERQRRFEAAKSTATKQVLERTTTKQSRSAGASAATSLRTVSPQSVDRVNLRVARQPRLTARSDRTHPHTDESLKVTRDGSGASSVGHGIGLGLARSRATLSLSTTCIGAFPDTAIQDVPRLNRLPSLRHSGTITSNAKSCCIPRPAIRKVSYTTLDTASKI